MNDDVSTRSELIRAARSLFAQYGYAATSVRAITAAAGANLGAITYHFGSKRDLYDEVVASVVDPLATQVEQVVSGGGDVADRIGDVVRCYFRYLAGNPDLPPLMMQELALAGAPAEAVAVPMRRVHAQLTALIEQGQRSGVIRSGPAAVMGIFILSVPVHLGLLREGLRTHMGIDLMEPTLRHVVTENAVAFVTAGLRREVE